MIVSWRVCACKGRSESERMERPEDLRVARRPCGVLDLLLLLGCPIALLLILLRAVLYPSTSCVASFLADNASRASGR